MKKAIFSLAVLSLSAFAANAQKSEDIKAIKSMCGCYEVDFKFHEVFTKEGNEPSDNYHSKALEWAEIVEESKDKIVLQHILLSDDDGSEAIIKHWRQDWEYQNTDLYLYDKDDTWKLKKLDKNQVKGQWTQKVYQVDDSPRYQGSATWVHVDGRHFWENVTDSPLPRREHTKRDDYNVLTRGNKHEITAYGWLHEQDNVKLNRTEAGDEVIAYEKGINKYVKVDDAKCAKAKAFWNEEKDFWAGVRQEWAAAMKANPSFGLSKVVEGKPLFVHFMAATKTKDIAAAKAIIAKFVKK